VPRTWEPPQAATSLELRTKLGTPTEPWGAWWNLGLYPEAGEGVAIFQATKDVSRRRRWPDRVVDLEAIGARRARTKVRRYCAANRLNRLGTLTYRGAGEHDQRVLRADVGEFFRRLRDAGDGQRFAYLWVAEWHPKGHGLHVHFAVGRFIRRTYIEEAWPHGFVHIKLIGDLPAGAPALAEARKVAWYLAPYVSKALGEGRERGMHRYEVAQGFMPRVVRFLGTQTGVIDEASRAMGSPPDRRSYSEAWTGYTGPPAVHLSWR